MWQLVKKHPVAALIFGVAVAVLAVRACGWALAMVSSYPSPESFVSAQVCVYREDDFRSVAEPLTADEEQELRAVLSRLRARGLQTDADTLPPEDGHDGGDLFLLTMDNGHELGIRTTSTHVVVNGSHAWAADASALIDLRQLHASCVASRQG